VVEMLLMFKAVQTHFLALLRLLIDRLLLSRIAHRPEVTLTDLHSPGSKWHRRSHRDFEESFSCPHRHVEHLRLR
jgi:hypothetical protein